MKSTDDYVQARWPLDVRGLANRSEGLANKSEGLGRPAWPTEVRGWGAGLAWALSIKVRGWGPGWPGPANRSEGLGQAQGLGLGRPGPA